MISAHLTCVGHGVKGLLFHVAVNGETIISRSVDPECAAARKLAQLGFCGPIEFVHANGMTGMYFRDILVAAQYRTAESRRGGLAVRKYEDFSAKREALVGASDDAQEKERPDCG